MVMSLNDFWVRLIQFLLLVVAEEAVLVDEVRDGGFEPALLHSQQAHQVLLVLLDCAQQDAAHDVSLLVLTDDLPDGLRVEVPDLMGDEGRVCQYKVEGVVVLFGDVFGVVEVILEEIGVILGEFGVELGGGGGTSKRKRGFWWSGLSMA
jgi:hypothetical protein